MSVAIGFSWLVPGLTTFETRPVALLTASGGGAVRSGGASRSLACARTARGDQSAATARAIAATERVEIGMLNPVILLPRDVDVPGGRPAGQCGPSFRAANGPDLR